MTWKKSDIKQCHRLLWDTEPVPCTDFLRMKSLDTTCFKTARGSNWFHTSGGSVHSPDPRFAHLSDASVYFKEHVIY